MGQLHFYVDFFRVYEWDLSKDIWRYLGIFGIDNWDLELISLAYVFLSLELLPY